MPMIYACVSKAQLSTRSLGVLPQDCSVLYRDLESAGSICPTWGLRLQTLLLPLRPLWTSPSTYASCSVSCTSLYNPLFTPRFSFVLKLQSAGIATSITAAIFCSLSSITASSWLAGSCLSIWNITTENYTVLIYNKVLHDRQIHKYTLI